MAPEAAFAHLQVADFGLSRSLSLQTRLQTASYGTVTHSALSHVACLVSHTGVHI